MKKNLLEYLHRAAQELSPSAVQVLTAIATHIELYGDARFPDSRLADMLGRRRETIAEAREQIVAKNFAEINTFHWLLKLPTESATDFSTKTIHHHDHHQEAEVHPVSTAAPCGNSGQSEAPPAALEETADPAPPPAVGALQEERDELVGRLVKLGATVSGAVHTVMNYGLKVIRNTLDHLPSWLPALGHVRNLAGYVIQVIRNGGWWYSAPKAVLEGAAERRPRPSVGSLAGLLPAPFSAPRKVAAQEPTRHQQERQAELAAREVEALEKKLKFEMVWAQLSELEQARARQLARQELPPVVLRDTKDVENSDVFRGILMGTVLELFRDRVASSPAPKAASPGSSLPWKVGGFVANLFTARGDAEPNLGNVGGLP